MNNAVYYHVAYVVAAVVYAGYLVSLRLRDRGIAIREAAVHAAAERLTGERR